MEQTYKTQVNKEGKIARTLEEQTSKIPSDVFLWASVGPMTAALVLKLARQKHMSLIIGQWDAPFLLFGIYNKLVKHLRHDKTVDK